MGALLGTILGAGLGYEGGRIKQQRAVEDKTVDMISQAALQDPTILQDKEMRGLIEKRRSKDYAMILDHIGQARSAQNAGFPASPGMGGNGATPAGAQPQGGVQPAMATQGARNYGPHESQGDLNDPNTWFQHIQAVRQYAAQFPGNAQLQMRAQQEVSDSQHHLESLQKQQDFESTRADRQQAHQDTEADRAQTRLMQQQLHQDTLGLQAQNAQFMHQLASMHEEDARMGHFNSATQNLQSQTQKIAAMLSSANPADRNTVKQLLKQRNAQAAMLQQQADKYGMDYDADQFKPLTVNDIPGWWQQHSEGIVGSSTPVLDEGNAATPANSTGGFKAGDRRTKDGTTYERNEKGEWHPVSP